jgi:hypothetical protein
VTADQAANQLEQRLKSFPWFISVGVGSIDDGDAIFLYVKSLRHRELRRLGNRWMGYPTVIRATGTIRALRHPQAFA